MKGWLRDLASLMVSAGIVMGALCGVRAYDSQRVRESLPEHRPSVYIISVSRVAYPDADVWLVAYAIDGHAEAAEIPTTRDPEEFLTYLKGIGDIEGRP